MLCGIKKQIEEELGSDEGREGEQKNIPSKWEGLRLRLIQ